MVPACYRRNRSITGPLPAVMKIYRHAGNAVTKLCTSRYDVRQLRALLNINTPFNVALLHIDACLHIHYPVPAYDNAI